MKTRTGRRSYWWVAFAALAIAGTAQGQVVGFNSPALNQKCAVDCDDYMRRMNSGPKGQYEASACLTGCIISNLPDNHPAMGYLTSMHRTFVNEAKKLGSNVPVLTLRHSGVTDPAYPRDPRSTSRDATSGDYVCPNGIRPKPGEAMC